MDELRGNWLRIPRFWGPEPSTWLATETMEDIFMDSRIGKNTAATAAKPLHKALLRWIGRILAGISLLFFSIRRFTIRRKASSDCWIIFSPHQRDRVLHPACCFNLHSQSLSYEYFLESTLDRWVFNG